MLTPNQIETIIDAMDRASRYTTRHSSITAEILAELSAEIGIESYTAEAWMTGNYVNMGALLCERGAKTAEVLGLVADLAADIAVAKHCSERNEGMAHFVDLIKATQEPTR